MSSLERMIERILDEAQQEAKQNLEAMDGEKAKILSEGKKQALSQGEDLINRAKEDSQLEKQRAVASAELASRDKILSKRLEVLERCFAQAGKELENLEDQRYLNFLKKTVSSLDLSGDERLLVPEDKRQLVKGILPLAEQSCEAGFIIEKQGIRYNYQFQELLDYQREELQDEIYELLFSRKE